MPERLPFLKLPLAKPSIRRSYHAALARVLSSGRLILGNEVAGFEEDFAKFCGARECVSVGNGTDALQIALRLSGVEPGGSQEVVTTPLTASFTAHAIVAAGGRPVFADVQADTLLLEPKKVEAEVTSRTAALLPVHLYGQACDLDELNMIARKRDLTVVQDAAQAHGTLYRRKPLTQFTDITCFSFYPTKNLGALGDGGALVMRSPELAKRARLFRDGGRAGGHSALKEAVNSRLDELQAAFLRIHLQHLTAWNQRRAILADTYCELFAKMGVEEVRPVAAAKNSKSFPHLFVIRFEAKKRAGQKDRNRKRLADFLATQGIETGIHYEQPLHLQPAFRRFGYAPGDFPNAELACSEILSLPMHPFLSVSDVRKVVTAIAKFFRK